MPHVWIRSALPALVFSLVPAAASAQRPSAQPTPAAPQQMTKPSPPAENRELDYFVGQWRCEGQMTMPSAQPSTTPGAPPSTTPGSTQPPTPVPYTAQLRTAPTLGGQWYELSYDQQAAGQMPAMQTKGYWGYQRDAKLFGRLLVDDMGAREVATSQGWQNDQMVWTGKNTNTGVEAPFRHTLNRTSDRSFTGRYEVQQPSGQWSELFHDSCTKTGPAQARRPSGQ